MHDDGTRKLGKELPWQDLDLGLQNRGWINLNQQKKTIEIKGVKIEARGTDDAHLARDNYSEVAGSPDSSVQLSIGVTHAPYKRVLDGMEKDGLQMIFAGHTHGGQVRLPWFGGSRALTTNCDLPKSRARGLTKIQKQPWLNVSAGMGTSPFARVRLACPSEISLIKFYEKSKQI